MAHPRILSLFSGIGGLDEGVRLALPGARVLAYVEREAYAAACLLARMEEGSMGPAPIWCGEIERLDVAPFVGAVDLVTAGFPCPGNSVAGKRLGTADPRWLWPHVIRIAKAVRARAMFFENPRGLLSVNDGRAFGSILRDLAGAGFNAEWAVLSAAEVGASHERQRVFLLARSVADSGDGFVPFTGRGPEGRNGTGSPGENVDNPADGRAGIWESSVPDGNGTQDGIFGTPSAELEDPEDPYRGSGDQGKQGEEGLGRRRPGGASEELADPSRHGPGEGRAKPAREQGRPDIAKCGGELADADRRRGAITSERETGQPDGSCKSLADASGTGPQEREGERGNEEQEFASAVGSLPLFAPGPDDPRWRDFPEFLWPSAEPGVRCVAPRISILLDPARAHQIRCVGNSCGILQAACAFVGLVRRF